MRDYNLRSFSQYFVKAADNEWHLRANTHAERIVEMVCVEQKHLFAMTVDGTMKRLVEQEDSSLQFNGIDFRNRSACAIRYRNIRL